MGIAAPPAPGQTETAAAPVTVAPVTAAPRRSGRASGELLRSYRFRSEREASWRALEQLIERADHGGLQALTTDELYRLPVLYRAVLSSLSVARAISLDRNVVSYLHGLSARAYLFLYGCSHDLGSQLRRFFRDRYPALVWSMRWWVVVAALLLAGGAASGYLLTLHDQERFHSFVADPVADGRSPWSTRDELAEVLTAGGGRLDTLSAFASFLFTHNARIGLSCFVVGFAAGVPTALLLFTNGLGLGAFAAIYSQQGLGLELWAWLLPHGVTELLAVCLCGAAGFRVGLSLVFPPDRMPRLASLARTGREAAAVVVGTVALFFLAALIEGFLRQLVDDQSLRFATAALTALAWAWYFGRHGARVAAGAERP